MKKILLIILLVKKLTGYSLLVEKKKNVCTGFAIVIINSIMAIYMIVKAKKNLKKLENKVAN